MDGREAYASLNGGAHHNALGVKGWHWLRFVYEHVSLQELSLIPCIGNLYTRETVAIHNAKQRGVAKDEGVAAEVARLSALLAAGDRHGQRYGGQPPACSTLHRLCRLRHEACYSLGSVISPAMFWHIRRFVSSRGRLRPSRNIIFVTMASMVQSKPLSTPAWSSWSPVS